MSKQLQDRWTEEKTRAAAASKFCAAETAKGFKGDLNELWAIAFHDGLEAARATVSPKAEKPAASEKPATEKKDK